jgi:AraC-like DNA-binding protein
VDEAKRLLLDPSYNRFNIQGIAFESGFKSKATFYAVFKQIVGMTPKQYKQHAKP